MKSRAIQFGVRENTASPKQHASRLNAPSTSNQPSQQLDELERLHQPESFSNTLSSSSPYSASHIEATAGEAEHLRHLLTVRQVAELLQVPVSWVYGRTRRRSVERIPGYRLGKYWRFAEADVLAWIARQQPRVG
jgi:excisionase family DNA binding protein